MSFKLGDEYINSRDVIERIEELESMEEDCIEEGESLDADDADELEMLRDLAKQGEDYARDWVYGATLIREDYFVAHCEQELIDCGYLPKDLPWFIAIDWEETAGNMRRDYTEIAAGEYTYLVL